MQGIPILDDLNAILTAHQADLDAAQRHPDWTRCATDIVHWINTYVYSYDPRLPPEERWQKITLWERQVELQAWMEATTNAVPAHSFGQAVIEKSRDTGATFSCVWRAVWQWLFSPGYSAGFGSRKEELVDRRNDPKSIFEKIRITLRRLPEWQLPRGFDWRTHDNEMLLFNPETGGTLTGEAGRNIGRGGRSAEYYVDEAAFLLDAEATEAALVEHARMVFWASTFNGPGNVFHRKRFSGEYPVFVIGWEHDERKNRQEIGPDGKPFFPWLEHARTQTTAVHFAQEIMRDPLASVEGILIPGRYLQAAVDFADWYGSCMVTRPDAGLDVSGETGAAENVLTLRYGPVVSEQLCWNGTDTTTTAVKAANECDKRRTETMAYDAGGLGEGVKSAFKNMEARPKVSLSAFLFGGATTKLIWPDGKTSKERFVNRRAEEYWKLMRRFERTFETRAGIKQHPFEDCISIPNDTELLAQLATIRTEPTETGKIKILSKQEMKKLGIKSPDRADSLVLCFCGQGSWAMDRKTREHLANLQPRNRRSPEEVRSLAERIGASMKR